MKITAPQRWRVLLDMARGGALTAIGIMLLLFFTEAGSDMPDWVKVALPVGSWIVVMCFFFAHRSPDGKSVEFEIR